MRFSGAWNHGLGFYVGGRSEMFRSCWNREWNWRLEKWVRMLVVVDFCNLILR